MAKPDSGLMSLTDIPAAIGLLTRLPLKVDAERATARGARAAWAYPLVGAVLGGLVGVPASALIGVLPDGIVAALVLAAVVILTGALHEDGLADSADGLWGAWEPARRLEIMKDSHIGSYGVIALIVSLLLRWLGLVALIESGAFLGGMIAVLLVSRGAMPVVMAALPHAREAGLSRHVGRPGVETAAIAVGLSVLGALACIGLPAIVLCGAAALATVAVGAVAKAKIGGQTGDILGATQQIAEIAGLLSLAAMLG